MANQIFVFLRKLKSFRVSRDILFIFYQSIVQTVLLYNQIGFDNSTKKVGFDNSTKKVDTERLWNASPCRTRSPAITTSSFRRTSASPLLCGS